MTLAAAMVLLSSACGGGKDTPPSASATATEVIPPDDRIRIPAISVDAPLVVRVVPRSGSLEDPPTPDDVAIYDFKEFGPSFGGTPGAGTILVAGKLDSGRAPCKSGTVPPPCTGVFWELNRLRPGNPIKLYWQRAAYEYTVVSSCWFDNSTGADFTRVVAAGTVEVLRLTTAGGNWNGKAYSHTLIVTAERSSGSASKDCFQGASAVAPTPAPTLTPTTTPTPTR